MTRYFLHIKGTPQQAVDALNAHGIDSFEPVTPHGFPRPGQTAVYSNTYVIADYGAQVSDWYEKTNGVLPFPVGTLLHYSIVD